MPFSPLNMMHSFGEAHVTLRNCYIAFLMPGLHNCRPVNICQRISRQRGSTYQKRRPILPKISCSLIQSYCRVLSDNRSNTSTLATAAVTKCFWLLKSHNARFVESSGSRWLRSLHFHFLRLTKCYVMELIWCPLGLSTHSRLLCLSRIEQGKAPRCPKYEFSSCNYGKPNEP